MTRLLAAAREAAGCVCVCVLFERSPEQPEAWMGEMKAGRRRAKKKEKTIDKRSASSELSSGFASREGHRTIRKWTKVLQEERKWSLLHNLPFQRAHTHVPFGNVGRAWRTAGRLDRKSGGGGGVQRALAAALVSTYVGIQEEWVNETGAHIT